MVNSFQRNLIKLDLKKKLDAWRSPSFRSQYLGNLTTTPTSPIYALERDENGHYFISDNVVSYSNLRNGTIFRMRKNWLPSDWDCYTALYNKGNETGKFRIDAPLHREILSYGSEEWEYAELQSPGSDYGRNFNDDVLGWPELRDGLTPNSSITDEQKDSVKNYFITFVDQSFEIIKESKAVAEKFRVGMPMDLCYIFNRYRDSSGYFWSDFDQYPWDISKDNIIEDALNKLNLSLTFAKHYRVLDSDRVQEINSYARDKWTTI